jgi:hypothetical protein
MPYKIQQDFCGHWEDAPWTEDEKPLRFATLELANAAIDEHIADCAAAVKAGDMETGYAREEFQAVPVEEYPDAHAALKAMMVHVGNYLGNGMLPSDCNLALIMPELETALAKFAPQK